MKTVGYSTKYNFSLYSPSIAHPVYEKSEARIINNPSTWNVAVILPVYNKSDHQLRQMESEL
jgi:hypothetical protein